MFKCKICNRIFKTIDPIGPHLSRIHKINNKTYYDMFLKKPGEGICPICGKETIFLSLTKGYQKHCSSKCAGLDDNTLKLRRNTCLEKYGCDSVFRKECEVYKNFHDEYYKRTGYLMPQANPATVECRIKNNLKKYGCISPQQVPEIRKRSRSKYYFNEKYFDSSWEIAYYIWLIDNKIDFEFHPNISFDYTTADGKVHKYFPDFKVGNELIEIKGDHLFGKHSMAMPIEKVQCMIDNGIKILCYTEIEPILNYIFEKYGRNYIKQFKK